MDEEWRPVFDWPDYAVSSQGRVYNTKRNRFMTVGRDRHGYSKVTLTRDGVYSVVNVHRLVAFAFVPGYFDGAFVNHIDGDKTYNVPENLEWVTTQQNTQHAVELGLIRKRRSWYAEI